MSKYYPPVEVRLAARTIPHDPNTEPDGCDLWIGGTTSKGYGSIHYNNRARGAHTVAWELANGRPVPDGHVVRHRCDNPRCVRPDHLLIGTQLDNMHDMAERGRRVVSRLIGESNGRAKLTDDEVRLIREMYSTGKYSRAVLGVMFGVTRHHIGDIIHGKSRKSA